MRKQLRKIKTWLRFHRLVWCVQCKKLMFQKDAMHEYTTTGLIATLCKECDSAMFHPFTGDKK
jgi:hypothetical protein